MFKKFNMLTLIVLIIGQTILGPMTVTAQTTTPVTEEENTEIQALIMDTEALQAAEEAVKTAEESLVDADKDAAEKLVDELEDSEDKEQLQKRLDAIEIPVEEDEAEATNSTDDPDESTVNPEAPEQEEEQEEPQAEVAEKTEEENLPTEDESKKEEPSAEDNEPLQTATKAVEKAEKTFSTKDYDNASALVKALEKSEEKTTLQNRLKELKETIKQTEKELEALQLATEAVKAAEASKLQEDIDDAIGLVEALKDGDEKEDLEGRLASLLDFSTFSEDPKEVEGNIIKGIQLKNQFDELIAIYPNNGEETVRPTIEDSIGIYFDWELPGNHPYKGGDTFTFQLPEEFKIYNEVSGQAGPHADFIMDVNGKVLLTFKDTISTGETGVNTTGTFIVNTELDKNKIEDSTDQKITFPLGEEDLEVNFHLKTDIPEDISKGGVPNAALNPTGAIWTVDFNKSEEEIVKPKFKDTITGEHTYKEESVKVYALNVKLDGTVEQGVEITSGFTVSGNLDIAFDETIDRAYRVIYETELEDGKRPEKLENTVQITGDNGVELKTNATVNLPYGELIEKEAGTYNDENQTAKWAVNYNYGELHIPADKAKFEDSFAVKTKENGEEDPTNAHAYDEDSFVVYPITFDKDGKEVKGTSLSKDEYSLVFGNDGNSFELDFKGAVDSAFKIEYGTKATSNVYEDHYVENIVETDGKTANQGMGFNQVVLNKSVGKVDYAKKEIEWTIELNKNLFPMKDITITDNYADQGMTLLPDSVLVNGSKENVTVTANSSYDEGFKIEFNGQGEEKKHIITYTTKFDPTVHDGNIQNKATVLWVEGTEIMPPKTDVIEVPMDSYTKNNGGKSGIYNAKQKKISWQVDINYNLHEIANPIVKDEYSEGQKLDVNSFVVQELRLTGEGNGVELIGSPLQKDTDYSVTEITNGFELVFNEAIDKKSYRITYETSVENEQVTEEYANKATLHDEDTEIASDLDTSVEVKQGGEYIGKEGAQVTGQKVIDWQLYVNRSQSDIVEGLKVTDKPGPEQVLIKDSIKVYGTTVAEDGTVTIDESVVLTEEDYELVTSELEDGSDKFTIQFKKAFSVPYAITYRTFINKDASKAGVTITNNVKLEGMEVESGADTGGATIGVRTSAASGTSSNKIGTLTIEKVDADDKNLKLDGAKFELWDSGNLVKIKEGTTVDGKVEFKNLLHGDYILKETDAPEGYVVGISSAGKKVVHEGQTIQVENKKIKRHIELHKRDSVDGADLAGAIFELFKSNNPSVPVTVKDETVFETDAEGKILLEDLDAGSYFFKEKEAPTDYQLSTRQYSFTIEEKQTEYEILNVTNTLKPGSATFTKRDADGPTQGQGLSGAEFTIEKQDGTFVKTVRSGADGTVNTGNLAPGKYTIEETGAPFGYKLTTGKVVFEIKRESAGESEHNITLADVTNEVKTTSIELTKIDSVKEHLLPNVEFALFDENKGSIQDADGNDMTATTSSIPGPDFGKLKFNDLKPGIYYVQELAPPIGYITNADMIRVEVTLNDVGYGWLAEKTIENHPFAHITLQKVDAETNYSNLAGAVFDVVDAVNTNHSIPGFTNLTTDNNGQISITGLPVGTYKLKETEAPTGYKIQGDGLTDEFTVSDNGSTIPISVGPVKNDIIKGSVELTKVDGDSGANLKGVEFMLSAISFVNNSPTVWNYPETTLATDENGYVKFDNLRPGRYKLVETKKLNDDYQNHWREYEFDISLQNDKHEYKLGEVKNYKLVDIDVEKNWKDLGEDSGRPTEITVDLFRSDNPTVPHKTETLTGSGDSWTYKFEGLDAVNSSGDKYTYTVQERLEKGYNSSVDGYEITNTAKKTDFELTKEDSISGAGLKGAEFTLTYPDGSTTQVKETDANGKLLFTDLQPGKYKLQETGTPKGYISDRTEHTITVTLDDVESSNNKVRDPIKNKPFADVQFTKVDAETKEALVGAEFTVFKVSDEDTEEALEDFKDLPVKADGTLSITGLPEGNYKLVETKAPVGYKKSTEGTPFTVDLKFPGEETEPIELNQIENAIFKGSVQLIKVDGSSADAPLANAVFSLVATSLENANETFLADYNVELAKPTYKSNSEGLILVDELRPGTYEFKEINVPDGYQETFVKDKTFGFTIGLDENGNLFATSDLDEKEITVKNYELVDIKVTKEWKDDNNATEERPEDITVDLFRSDDLTVPHKTQSVTGSGNTWTYTFKDLEAVDSDGTKYTYTVEESDEDNYKSKITGDEETGFTITNTRIGITAVSGKKNWVEGIGGEQYRPSSITVNLLADGIDTGKSTTIGNDDGWKYSFKNLKRFDAEGKEITYSVKEVDVPNGYVGKVDTDGFTIINTQETIEISGTKTWNDPDELSRPKDGITVQVMKGTEVVTSKEISDVTGKTQDFTFTDLPKYDKDGEKIKYTINEVPVEGYVADIVGDDITNTRTESTNISVTKEWKDEDIADRPTEITVVLSQKQGDKVIEDKSQKIEPDNAGNWTHTFENLPSFDSDGKPYTYTVEEVNVDEKYSALEPVWVAAENGFKITNVRTGTIEVEGTKTWLDDNATDRPDKITVNLLQNDVVIDSREATKATDWKYSFTGLQKYDEEGKAYTYKVDELSVDGYESTVTGFNLTNLRVDTTKVEGTKIWLDDNATDRPTSIEIQLTRAVGEVVDESFSEKRTIGPTDWTYSFTDLDKFNDEGVAYTYSVEEADVPTGYESTVDGYDITNLRVGTTVVSGEKIWDEVDETYRPGAITIQLLADGKPAKDPVEVTADTSWKYEFTDLPQYDEEGKEIEYTIEELEVKGYVSTYVETADGFDITNTQEKTTVPVTKIWKDDANENRPTKITVQVKDRDRVVQEKTLTVADHKNADNEWTYTFTDLAKYNKAGEEIQYTVTESDLTGYEADISDFTITNVRTGTTQVEITKSWKDENETDRPERIKVNLLQNETVHGEYLVTAENDWTLTIDELPQYDEEGIEYVYSVTEHDVAGYTSNVEGLEITNTRAATKNIEVTKTWLDDEKSANRPDKIEVELFRATTNGDKEPVKVYEISGSANDKTWSLEIKDLPSFNEDGKAYTYSIEEKKVAGYTSKVNGFNITNLRTDTTAVSGTKTWLDTLEEHDAITVKLFANGVETDKTTTADAESNWTYEFTNLDKYDDKGVEISYTVDEVDVEGYEKSIEGHDITNLRVGTTIVEGTKTWIEVDENYRPDSIAVNLLANGEQEKTVEVSKATDWKYAFTDLPQYDAEGKEITYTIEEVEVAGYNSVVNGFNLTNTQEKISIPVTKAWLDETDEKRPNEITVQVKTGTTVVKEATITADKDWKHVFTDLAKYDKAGMEIQYTVVEVNLDDHYKFASLTGEQVDGFTITNLRTGKTSVDITKTWKDDKNATEDRPETIKVNLLQNGDFYKEYELSATDKWTLKVEDLPEFDEQGKAYAYSVTEQDVAGYASAIDGFDITNTRTDKKDIEMTKTWLDDESKDRPREIEVELYRSIADAEKELVDTYTLSAGADWSHKVKDLPVFDADGKAYTYTIEEVAVDGYKTTINGFDITNLRVGTTDVSGEKTWVEVDENYRPDSITVNVIANGNACVESQDVDGDWTYSFKDLPKYDHEGKMIDYTIEEVEVAGYTSVVDGFNITNTQATTTVPVTKTWQDDNSKDRPTSITVQVMNGETVVKEAEVTADNEWQHTFEELAKYDKAGTEIAYTVTESAVTGYETSIDGYDITNLRTGKTSVDITKTWKDDKNATEDRPETIQVNLLQNGDFYKEYELSATDKWTLKVEGLPEFDATGKAFTYTVNEHDVAGYASKIDGFEITNTRTDKKDIEMTKTWLDDESKDRPREIEVELYRSIADAEKELVDIYTLSADADWSHKVKDLPVFDADGKAYTYSIEEVAVDGYETTINGFDIINLRVGTRSVEGTKTWKADKESDRPVSITVELLQNGKVIDEKKVTKADNWKYSFTDLATHSQSGKKYVYTVSEQPILGYDTEIDGTNITNIFNLEDAELEMEADPKTIIGDGKSTSTLTTTVTDKDGKPVPGIEVTFDAERGTFPEGSKAITDENGKATVIFKSDRIEDTVSHEVVVNATVRDKDKGLKGEDKITITFEPSSITGVVVDNVTHKPVEGAKIVVTDPESGFKVEFITGPDGKYKIPIPKGEITYDVEITKTIIVNGKPEEVTFEQKAKPGKINPTEIDEEFPAEKTFVGVVLLKDKDGKEKIIKKENGKKYIIKGITPNGFGKQGEINESGVFVVDGLEKGKEYQFAIIQEIDGKELIMGSITVTIGTDGEISIHEELIDPYGTITDKHTGEIIGGAEVELRYADTERNRKNGRIPGTLVELPILPGFAPNDNKNTQFSSNDAVWNDEAGGHGNYAWMVYPEADYYIVSKKPGYKDYTSPMISVEYEIVKHDFKMERIPEEPVDPPEPEESGKQPVEPEEVEPVDPKPEEVEQPTKPVEPSQPETDEQVKAPNDVEQSDKPEKLPQTGEEHFIYMIVLGVLFSALGGTILYRQRRKA